MAKKKGKKAWRKNIDTSELESYAERSGREERSGGPLHKAVDEELFFVDKAGDETVGRKIDKYRSKVLHCDSVLQRSSMVPPLPSSKKRRTKDRDLAKPVPKSKPVASKVVALKAQTNLWDPWSKDAEAVSKKKKIKKDVLPNAPAVEVDVPGCSFNPTFEDHQDALGLAVAQEMQYVYQKELQPEPIPVTVEGNALEEEDLFFLEADNDELDEEEDSGTGTMRAVKNKKLTRADRNKKARRQHVLKEEAERQKRARLGESISKLPEIKKAISEEEEENKKLRIRRMASRKERLESGPPRLGKYKFKPEPMQVLLSEEVTGSLRKLKGCCSLLRERYKSIQRRGLVEPRIRVKKRKGRGIEYEPGSKGWKERQEHASKQAEQEANKHAIAVVPL